MHPPRCAFPQGRKMHPPRCAFPQGQPILPRRPSLRLHLHPSSGRSLGPLVPSVPGDGAASKQNPAANPRHLRTPPGTSGGPLREREVPPATGTAFAPLLESGPGTGVVNHSQPVPFLARKLRPVGVRPRERIVCTGSPGWRVGLIPALPEPRPPSRDSHEDTVRSDPPRFETGRSSAP